VVRASSSQTTTTVGTRNVNTPSGTFGMSWPITGDLHRAVSEYSAWMSGVLIGFLVVITNASER